MKRVFKRIFITTIITMIACILFSLSAFAGNGIENRINALRSKYPDGYFWNHQVTTNNNNGDQLLARGDESFSESVTGTPCQTHRGAASVGQYDCNYFDGGIQCFGFARRVFFDIFGVRASSMEKRYDTGNIQVGDYIRINNDGHSAVVIARNGNTLTLVEANLDLSGPAYNCKIRWGATCDISKVTFFRRASNYESVNGGQAAAPTYFTNLWHSNVTEDDAKIDAEINTTYIESCGFYLGTSTENMYRHNEPTNNTIKYIWYNLKSDYAPLVPGTTYYYKMYIVVGGKEYGTEIKSFTTGGKTPEMTMPTITFDKNSYAKGDKVTFSWAKTSTGTDFYQYWVIVDNVTTNKNYYAGATGDAGDVSKNTYSFTASETGKYKITVYSVPYNNKDTRQKADVKYIEVANPHTHSYKSSVTKAATCTATGTKTFTCSCGDKYTETIKATGHKFGEYKPQCDFTNFPNDTQIRTCKTCKTTQKEQYKMNYGSYYVTSSSGADYVKLVWGELDDIGGVKVYQYDKTKEKYFLVKNIRGYSESYKITGLKANTEYAFLVVLYGCWDWSGEPGENMEDEIDSVTKVTIKTKNSHTHTYKTTTTKATLKKNGKTVKKCTGCTETKTTTIYYPKSIKLSATSYTYNGKVKSPSITVKDSKGKTLKKDTDYTVKYEKGRKLPGKYTVTVTFKGKYSGTKKLYFTIKPEKIKKFTVSQTTTTVTIKWNKIAGVDAYRVYKYNSKKKKYDTVTDVKGTSVKISKLKAGTLYNFKVRGYKKDGETIGGVHSDEIIVATKPATVKISKVTAGKKQMTATWKTVSGASGYQVVYSTSKKFTSKTTKKVTVKKGSSKKTTIKKLTKGKKYYVKVRAYKTVNKKNIYGAYSSVKNIKVK